MKKTKLPQHIAIIMDGNRRWAKARGIDIKDGHKAGAENLKKIAKYANKIGIKYLTVYAFSTENWKRSKQEIGYLMNLLKIYVENFLNEAVDENIKINILGDIAKLEQNLQNCLYKIMNKTKNNTGLILNIAFNYGGKDEIVKAIQKISNKIKNDELKPEEINERVVADNLYTAGQPNPDLLIRSGGEKRISNYLIWQLAYTEFLFIDKSWPEFSEKDLDEAIYIFNNRNRKFGGK